MVHIHNNGFEYIKRSTLMHIYQYIILLCISLTIGIQNTQAQASKKSGPIVYTSENYETENALYAPITFTPEGVRGYLCNAYNKKEYSQDVLPHNLAHCIQFLEHGKNSKQNRAYIKSVFKLFTNKIKATPHINAYAFSAMLEQLSGILADYFIITRFDSFDKHKEVITDILYASFLSKYDMFKKNTQEFFETLSQEILDTMHNDLVVAQENAITIELRQAIIRFLELGLSKLIWSPEDHQAIWPSIKKISHQLEALLDRNIIEDANDLDDLYWSLIHRFCYFLEITGSSLPVDFYEHVKNEMATQPLLMLELEEQESLLETKAKWLMRALLENQAKVEADKHGIVVR